MPLKKPPATPGNCSACGERKPREDYTPSQLMNRGPNARCKACVEQGRQCLIISQSTAVAPAGPAAARPEGLSQPAPQPNIATPASRPGPAVLSKIPIGKSDNLAARVREFWDDLQEAPHSAAVIHNVWVKSVPFIESIVVALAEANGVQVHLGACTGMVQYWNALRGRIKTPQNPAYKDPNAIPRGTPIPGYCLSLFHVFRARNLLMHNDGVGYTVDILGARWYVALCKELLKQYATLSDTGLKCLEVISNRPDNMILAKWEMQMASALEAQKAASESLRAANWVVRDWLFATALEGSPPARCLVAPTSGFGLSAFVAQGVHSGVFEQKGVRVAAYHFCCPQRRSTLQPADYVRSLAKQMSRLVGAYGDKLETDMRLREHFDEANLHGLQGAWDSLLAGVWQPLQAICSEAPQLQPALVLVSGLHNALDADDSSHSIAHLVRQSAEHLSASPELQWLRILCTSQDHPRLGEAIRGINILPVGPTAEDREVLQSYARSRIASSAALSASLHKLVSGAPGSPTQESVLQLFVEKAHGSFQRAVELLDDIEGGYSSFAALESAPSARAEHMVGKLRHLSGAFATYRPVLEVLMASAEPLHVREVLQAVNLDITLEPALIFRPPDGRQRLLAVLKELENLGLVDNTSSTIALRRGVRDGLLSGGTFDPSYSCSPLRGHALLAAVTLWSMTLPACKEEQLTLMRTLLGVAAPALEGFHGNELSTERNSHINAMLRHLKQYSNGEDSPSLRKLSSLVEATGVDFHRPHLQASSSPRKGVLRKAPLHWLAAGGCSDALDVLLACPCPPGDGSPTGKKPAVALRRSWLGCTVLTYAVSVGQVGIALQILKSGREDVNFDQTDNTRQFSILHMAISAKSWHGHPAADITQTLVDELDRLNPRAVEKLAAMQDSDGHTALHLAIKSDSFQKGLPQHPHLLRRLATGFREDVDRTPTVRVQDNRGLTPIMLACELLKVSMVETLLAVNAEDERQQTLCSLMAVTVHERQSALHFMANRTVKNENLQKVLSVLASIKTFLHQLPDGANKWRYLLKQPDSQGETALAIACRNGADAVVSALLADSDELWLHAFVNCPENRPAQRPFSAAAQAGRVSILRSLRPFVHNDPPGPGGNTALLSAAANGHVAVVIELLSWENGPQIDPNARSLDGRNLLMHLASSGPSGQGTGRARQLRQMKPARQAIHGKQASKALRNILQYMAGSQASELMESVWVSVDKQQRTAVFCAAEVGNLSFLTAAAGEGSGTSLLSHHVVNLPDANGLTPLMAAAKNGFPEVVQLLSGIPGVDLNATDNEGATALFLAASSGHLEVVQELLSKDDTNTESTGKRPSPLVEAIRQGHKQVVQELVNSQSVDINAGCPIIEAIKTGDTQIYSIVAYDCQDTKLRNWACRDEAGKTALMWAAESGLYSVAAMLITHYNSHEIARAKKHEQKLLGDMQLSAMDPGKHCRLNDIKNELLTVA